ncbi:MAG: TVP38/TMEM64 family protein [Clostridiales bacterium]|nr:TVP38/TMEM64 family protein [Clostridiales bacterium]
MKKKIAIGVGLLLIIIVFRVSGLDTYLNTNYILERRTDLLEAVQNNFVLTAFIFMLVYIGAVAFSVPGAAVLSLTGGLLFGLIPGLVFVNIGATLGATLNFIFARYVIGDTIQKKHGDKLEKFNEEIEKNGKNYLLTLRLIPIFPFFLINVLAGLTAVKLKTFIWTTAVGIIPGSVFYVYAGTTLKEVDALADFLSWRTTLPLVLLGLLAFLPVLYNKFRKRSNE